MEGTYFWSPWMTGSYHPRFKLQFFRTAAPGPSPSWDSALQDGESGGVGKDGDPFGHVSPASEAQRQTVRALRGG